jgi:ferric-dicitrate binding protein FerR (iron transport regulator)
LGEQAKCQINKNLGEQAKCQINKNLGEQAKRPIDKKPQIPEAFLASILSLLQHCPLLMEDAVKKLPLCCLLAALLLGCQSKDQASSSPPPAPADTATGTETTTAATPEATDSPVDTTTAGWTGKLDYLASASSQANVSILIPGQSGFVPLNVGDPIPNGATVRTSSATQAGIALDGDGVIILDKSSELVLLDKARSARLDKGQANFDLPPGQPVHARITLPTGEVELLGTKVNCTATEALSKVLVSRGAVEVRTQAGPLRAGPGDEVQLPKGEEARVGAVVELGEATRWLELPEDVVVIQRGMGSLTARRPGSDANEHALRKASQKVSVSIHGALAYTEVTEVFANDTSHQLEGIYRFPIPSDANISRLALLVDGELIEGAFVENERAERIWQGLINVRKDPALLKWQHGNQFELRIFPIEAHSSRQVTLGYLQTLPLLGNDRLYAYALPFDKAAKAVVDRFEFNAQLSDYDTSRSVQPQGYDALAMHSGKTTKVSFDADHFQANGDLRLLIPSQRNDAPQVLAFKDSQHPDEDAWAMISLSPSIPRQSSAQHRDLMLILDNSYRRQGETMALQRRFLSHFVKEMDEDDRLMVLHCNQQCAPLGPNTFQPPSPELLSELDLAYEQLQAQGGSHLLESIRVAKAIFDARQSSENAARLVFVTDGIASLGELEPATIKNATQQSLDGAGLRLSLVDLGGDSDTLNLRALAEGGNGRVFSLDPERSMSANVLNILGAQYAHELNGFELSTGPELSQVYSSVQGTLMDGEEVLILARVGTQTSSHVTLRGQLDQQPFEQRFELQLQPSSERELAFIPKLWAKARIDALELSDEKDARAELIALSTRYGVLSRHTSLLALESKQMMRDYGLRTGELDTAYEAPSPDESEPEADHNLPLAGAAPQKAASAPKAKADKQFDYPAEFSDRGGYAMGKPKDQPDTKRARGKAYGPRVSIKAAAQASAERQEKRIERSKTAHEAEPLSVEKRKSYIRTLASAGRLDEAQKVTQGWLELDPLDPEALVLAAENQARLGHVALAQQALDNAMDTAPRAKWLRERLLFAAQSRKQGALACAHQLALDSILGKTDSAKQCPLLSELEAWGIQANTKEESAPAEKQGKHAFTATLSWSGDAQLDLFMVLPNERVLSWLGGSSKLAATDVDAPDREQISLKTLPPGTSNIEVVRVDDGTQPIKGELRIEADKKSKTFSFEIVKGSIRIAEIDKVEYGYRPGWR